MNNGDMQNTQSAIIQLTGVSKAYRDGRREVNVLKGLDLTVTAGEMLAIIGQSGSGKSTLLHLVGALDTPTEGQVQVMGQDIHAMSAKAQGLFRNEHLGFVYQFLHLLPEFTALENVAMPLLIAGQAPADCKKAAHRLIDAVGLSNRADHKPGELSGGEKQRIALARALITQPDCVLADEPTGNLDHKTADATLDLMLKLNEEFKTSFVVVTHDQALASKMHRTLLLEDGVLTTSAD